MRVKLQHNTGCLTASLFGELDHHSAPEVKGALDDALRRFSDADLVLDLKNLSFMDSSGLGVLLGPIQAAQGARPRVCMSKTWGGRSKRYSPSAVSTASYPKSNSGGAYEKRIMELKLLSLSENESFARSVVGAFATQLDPTLEEVADIKTAVSEAVTNCIVHAYPNVVGEILIIAELFRASHPRTRYGLGRGNRRRHAGATAVLQHGGR